MNKKKGLYIYFDGTKCHLFNVVRFHKKKQSYDYYTFFHTGETSYLKDWTIYYTSWKIFYEKSLDKTKK